MMTPNIKSNTKEVLKILLASSLSFSLISSLREVNHLNQLN